MPNYCDFDIHARGKKKDILTLFDWMNADYRYTESTYDMELRCYKPLKKPECYVFENGVKKDVAHHIGYRIFELNFDASDFKDAPDDEELCLYGWGYCAWSVYTCMFSGPHTYYSDAKDYPVSLSVTLPDACKMLSVEAEIYSSESGCTFAEHYHVNGDGEILSDECTKFFDVYIDEYGSFEDYEKMCKEEYGEEPLLTKETFENARDEGECSVAICEWLDENRNWPFEII